MLVALDAEDALRALGAEAVTVAPNVRAAARAGGGSWIPGR